ncbi:MAG: hypothetical protein H6718_07460 [Polyangiaceae bacterium]|nr:hypothetical protein [Polyangiaceae bacterium]
MSDKEQVATDLIRHHFEVEPHLVEVWRFFGDNEASPREPIKLLEVNVATVSTGGVTPFRFRPSHEVPFAVIIAEITPEEFEAVKQNPSLLPTGWSLAPTRAQRFERHA